MGIPLKFCAQTWVERLFGKLKAFCEEQGIHLELAMPCTHKQNDVTKRKNQTVVEMAHSLMKGKDLPIDLWAKMVATVVFLLNLYPRKAMLLHQTLCWTSTDLWLHSL